jgi:hypothetical protein
VAENVGDEEESMSSCMASGLAKSIEIMTKNKWLKWLNNVKANVANQCEMQSSAHNQYGEMASINVNINQW